jgi:transposase
MKKPSKHLIAEVPRSVAKVGMTIGIDLGDVWSHYCTLNEDGEVVDRGRFRTTLSGVEKWFTDVPMARVAMETGTHSIWISEQLHEMGHEVIVANVRELRAISHSDRKSDQVDAEKLARYARLDPEILRPISHRTVAQQEALTLIRARNLIVRLRTAAVNSVRGLAKPCGYRLPASSTLCFAKRCMAVLPPGLALALGPVLEQIAAMTVKIQQYDRTIKRLTETEYPETQALLKVYGVGQLTALTYVLTLGSKERFKRSRDVGCYLGLRPRRSQSGKRDPQLGITKAGNIYLRSLLVECANHVLGPRGKDSTLRQWGLHLAARGGKQSHNRAIVAVARKLAVLLHRIWITQAQYIPFYAVAA